ncbi:MAG: hypothetical protein K0S29_626 [Gammaproteobacteria bacterium]|jgi:hypothetical protein|nr:hypothetical protein [Gammaproteobacteria bacterium]
MNQAAQYIFLSEVRTTAGHSSQVLSILEKHIGSLADIQFYHSESLNSIVILQKLQDPKQAFDIIKHYQEQSFLNEINPLLMSDWRRQVLELKETVKAQNQPLPNTASIQLRYIEVPLRVYEDYLSWRRQTIFEHVKKEADIKSFCAYHSLLSTQPGVMFISGFDCDEQQYLSGFSKASYQEIVKQAGQKYIAGGERGLYTTIYHKTKS